MKKPSSALKKIVLRKESIRVLANASLHDIVAGIVTSTTIQSGKGAFARPLPIGKSPLDYPTCN